NQVFFNGQASPNVTPIDPYAVSAEVPPSQNGDGSVDIRVVTPWNETTKSGIFEYYSANRLPTIENVGDKQAAEEKALQFTLRATDPDGDPLTLTALLADGQALNTIGAAFVDNHDGTGAFSWTPAFGQAGLNPVVIFRATDPDGAEEGEVITITVNTRGVVATWRDLVGAQAQGNTVTKTAANGWGNSGAFSVEGFSGNGGIEFVAAEANTIRVAGLSTLNRNADYRTIDFGIALWNDGTFRVYEGGVLRGNFGNYVVGDRFFVERSGNQIAYKKNNQVFFRSARQTAVDLWADVAISTQGGTISNAKWVGVTKKSPALVDDLRALPIDAGGAVQLIWRESANNLAAITHYTVYYGTVASGQFGNKLSDDAVPGAIIQGLQNGQAYQFRVTATNQRGDSFVSNVVRRTPNRVLLVNVQWIDLVGVNVVNGNTIVKTKVSGWANSGAASVQHIAADGGVEFLASKNNTTRICGLSSRNADANYLTVDYGIMLMNNRAIKIYERGVDKGTFGQYAIGDVFVVDRTADTIVYKKNGQILYRSERASAGELLVDAAINTQGGEVARVRLRGF
ncbi:MAG: fibronectin type III domain-containing protein, partial [Candidatus Omnitrophica bacterium]|nr:fibronectin type III domain-containing protein [Candidatus Omnitrophota bacterium]